MKKQSIFAHLSYVTYISTMKMTIETFVCRVCACALALPFFTSCMCGGPGSEAAAGNAPGHSAVNAAALSSREKVGNIVEFDKVIHNFGDVMLSDGALQCSFQMKNISEKPVVIYNVVTSCGCTDVKWTREPIMPGKSGSISSTYTNDEGPYPFDKTLTVYVSGLSKPVILRLRGISHAKEMSLEELFPVRLGTSLGIKSVDLKCGNVEQGSHRSDEVNIANLSDKPVSVSFENVSAGLSLRVEPNPIPARSKARLQFTVTADRKLWGKNFYYATPVADGSSSGTPLSVYAFTKEDFSAMSEAERLAGSRPIFSTNTYSAGQIKPGTVIDAEFIFSNAGQRDFVIYKIDTDSESAVCHSVEPVKAGYKGKINITLDTAGMPKGEMLVTCNLTTNSPSRPIVNLFIVAMIM